MSVRPETLALLDRFLSNQRSLDDVLAQLRDLVCDVVTAGDDLHGASDILTAFSPKLVGDHVYSTREAWRIIGGQQAVDRFDHLAQQIRDMSSDD